MIKHFCDHCGKEIVDMDIYYIDDRDFADVSYMKVKKFFNKILCQTCYHQRLQWHLDVDEVFFHMVEGE